jgi:hypothetical protein
VTPLNGVEYIIGDEKVDNTPLPVFDGGVLGFLGEVSASLLRSPLGRIYPDISAFAFYVRKANLQKLKDSFGDTGGRIGRGLCFHVTPANIPINFAFSWFFSLLAGNSNIVRLPSKMFPQVNALCDVLKTGIKEYPEIAKRTAFVRYPKLSTATAELCARADVRMIWGGDATIASIKALSAAPRCVDIAFADRYSVALIDAPSVLRETEAELRRLAENFYNDTFLMDQNACSSPQVILWQNDDSAARERFWEAVEAVARKRYVLQDAVSVDKYTLFCEEAISNPHIGAVKHSGNLLYRVELDALDTEIVSHRGKAGFFFEYSLGTRDDLFAVVTEKFQTVTQFGIDVQKLRDEIVSRHLRGIDRIVPIGQAMNIDAIWDGYDLIRTLSRIVTV